MKMDFRLFKIGKYKLLVTRPNCSGYAHLALEMIMSLYIAKAEGSRVYFVKSPGRANHALFETEWDRVKIIPPSHFRDILATIVFYLSAQTEKCSTQMRKLTKGFRGILENFQEAVFPLRRRLDQFKIWTGRLNRQFVRSIFDRIMEVAKNKRYPMRLRRFLKRCAALLGPYRKAPKRTQRGGDLAQAGTAATRENANASRKSYGAKPGTKKYILSGTYWGWNFRRLAATEPIEVRLRARKEQLALELAGRVGLDSTSKIVTVHVRESGYYGLQDKGRDDRRNARIETYFPAIDHLVERGYAIVRIGDPTMTPVNKPGVIDLATSPHQDGLLELWCLMRSDFMIGCNSGPNAVCSLTDTPLLRVNAVEILLSYPRRRRDLYIFKRVADRKTGRALSLSEMLENLESAERGNLSAYEYIDNTPEEIYRAVGEMQDTLRRGPKESAAQREFKERLLRAAIGLKNHKSPKVRRRWIRKQGSEEIFLGEGRVAHFFADRYLFESDQLIVQGRRPVE